MPKVNNPPTHLETLKRDIRIPLALKILSMKRYDSQETAASSL